MNERIRRLHERFYDSDPAWINGTAQFGSLVRKYLRPDMVILNLGAGPGTGSLHFDRDVSIVIGLDPEPSITRNRRISYRVRGVAEALPFRNECFDLVYMDWVIEHLPQPHQMAKEVFRTLKVGGKLAFRTGNLFHYSYAIAAATPHAFHKLVLHNRHDEPHPTFYRMNTIRRVRTIMSEVGFLEDALFLMEPDPAYLCMSRPTFLMGVAYERMVNRFAALSPFRANILGVFFKPPLG